MASSSTATTNIIAEDKKIPNVKSSHAVVFFKQGNYDKVPYGSGSVKNCGCGICSLAMAVSYLCSEAIDPVQLLKDIEAKYGDRNHFYTAGQGSDMGSMISGMASTYKYKFVHFPDEKSSYNYTDVVPWLNRGAVVIMSCKNNSRMDIEHPEYDWTDYTHIVLLSGIASGSGDRVICHNPSHPEFIGYAYDMATVDKIRNNGYWALYKEDFPSINSLNTQSRSVWDSYQSTGGAYDPIVAAGASYTEISSETTNGLIVNKYKTYVHYNSYQFEFGTATKTYAAEIYKSIEQKQDLINTGLLTYPTLVEAPFIWFKVGDYTFGTYKSGSAPNFIESMEVKKINGQVNEYTINLRHQIEAGADPNFVDKILSGAQIGAKVYISYGDYCAPSYTFKEEEAILLKTTSNVDFKSSAVTYTIHCTSNATQLYARVTSFDKKSGTKPSDVIYQMLWGSGENTYGLKDVFPGMYTEENYKKRSKFIASDDKAVDIPAKTNIDPLSYINYLVTCMCSITNTDTSSVLKDSVYKLCMYDTNFDDSGTASGAYFKIVKQCTSDSSQSTLQNQNIYEVDIGYPTDNMVMDFSVKTDDSWALLYKYSGTATEITYTVDSTGETKEQYLPAIAISSINGQMNEAQRTWWTNMTRFNISAQLTLKGLLRPAMLMSYIRINAVFYGQRHISSGLYVITSQTDSISGSGYRTTLELYRVAGDTDYVETVTKTKTIKTIKRTGVTKSRLTNIDSSSTEIVYDTQFNFEVINEGYTNDGFSRHANDPQFIINSAKNEVEEIYKTYQDVFPIYAALYVAINGNQTDFITTPVLDLQWAASAAQYRNHDYYDCYELQWALYEFIHANSYAQYDRMSQYKYLSNNDNYHNSEIFSADSVYAYEAVYEKMFNSKSVDPNNQFDIIQAGMQGIEYVAQDGQTYKIYSPDKNYNTANNIINNLYQQIISGKVVTTANYFSNSFVSLSCGQYQLSSQDEIYSHLSDEKYFKLYETTLSGPAEKISGTYVGRPTETSRNLYIIDSSVGERTLLNTDTSSVKKIPGDNIVWNTLIAAGATEVGAAAMLGNIYCEGYRGPQSVNDYFANRLIADKSTTQGAGYGYTWTTVQVVDKEITNMLDDEDSEMWDWGPGFTQLSKDDKNLKFNNQKAWNSDFPDTGWAYGFCQWCTFSRKLGLSKYAKSQNSSIGDAKIQAEWIIQELNNGYSKSYTAVFKDTMTLKDATAAIFNEYEGAGDKSLDNRIASAYEAYKLFTGKEYTL